MSAVFAILLILTVFIRPQEFIPALQPLSLLNVFTVLAVLTAVFESLSGKKKLPLRSPQLAFLAAFIAWAFLATFIRIKVDAFEKIWKTVGFSAIFMLVTILAGRTYKRIVALACVLCAVSAFLIGVGIAQARADFQCIEIPEAERDDTTVATGIPNGKSCLNREGEPKLAACYDEDDPTSFAKEFMCEKVGPFDTFSIGKGRVRWRGILADPNELSLAIGASLAFVLGIYGILRGKLRHLGVLAIVGGAGYVVIQTQSRGGILVLLAVFAVYFVRRYGLKGIAFGAVMGAPLLLLGGREGEEARASTIERTEALYEGINMVKEFPVFGVGVNQFTDHHIITAHNSYLLAASELGFIGMVLWTSLFYVSVKIPVLVATSRDPGLEHLRPLAFSLVAAFAAIAVGITFLSFSYHNMLFIYLGLAGALYGVAREESPRFKMKVKAKEIALVAAADAALLLFLFVYTRLKV